MATFSWLAGFVLWLFEAALREVDFVLITTRTPN